MPESCRENLIDAANRLFYDRGFHAVGLDQVLDEVGVTKTTFYNHFESKDDLIIAVLEQRDRRETVEWMEAIKRRGGDDPRARILSLFDLIAEWLGEPGFKGCMFIKAAAEFPEPNDPVHRTAARHAEQLSAELTRLAGLAGAADPNGVAAQLMLVIGGAIVAQSNTRDSGAGRTARLAAELLLDYHLRAAAAA